MSFMLETPRLLLRPFRMTDAEEYFTITQDEKIKRYVSYATSHSFSQAQNTIEKVYSKCDFEHDFYLVIVEKSSSNIIGAIILTQSFTMKHYDCCYFIAQKYRRKGFMKEALEAFLHAFPLNNAIVLFEIKEDNTASLNLISQIDGIKELHSDTHLSSSKQFYYLTV